MAVRGTPGLFEFGERALMKKHLESLQKRGMVFLENAAM